MPYRIDSELEKKVAWLEGRVNVLEEKVAELLRRVESGLSQEPPAGSCTSSNQERGGSQ